MENLTLREVIEWAADEVEAVELSEDKAFRDAVYAEAGVKTKSEYFATLISVILESSDELDATA